MVLNSACFCLMSFGCFVMFVQKGEEATRIYKRFFAAFW